jgi:hypothetical protein
MPLAAKIGLVDYWEQSGKWPDFCAEPGLPYDLPRGRQGNSSRPLIRLEDPGNERTGQCPLLAQSGH